MEKFNVPNTVKNALSYKYVWGDEFDGSELNRKVWVNYGNKSDDDAVIIDENGEKHTFVGNRHQVKSDGVYVDEGNAVIEAIHSVDSKTGEHSFVNRQISTSGTMSYKYGYLEIKAKLPVHPNAVAFWLGSTTSPQTKAFTELDMIETIYGTYNNDEVCLTNIHSWDDDREQKRSLDDYPTEKDKATKIDMTLSKEFHTYGFEWTPDVMKFYMDGNCYYSYSITDGVMCKKPNGDDNVDTFRQPMDLRLSSTMGLGFYGPIWSVGEPDKTVLLIDYVRLFQIDDGESELYINGKKK